MFHAGVGVTWLMQVLGYGLDGLGWILSGAKYFSLLHDVQTGSGGQKNCYGFPPHKSLKYHSRRIYSFETYSCWSTHVKLKLQYVFYVSS